MRSRTSEPPKFVTPSVPQFLVEREEERGCRQNRRLDPHERAVAGLDDDLHPCSLLETASPGSVLVFYLGMAFVVIGIIGQIIGWWKLPIEKLF